MRGGLLLFEEGGFGGGGEEGLLVLEGLVDFGFEGFDVELGGFLEGVHEFAGKHGLDVGGAMGVEGVGGVWNMRDGSIFGVGVVEI